MHSFHHVFNPETDDASALTFCSTGHVSHKSVYRSLPAGRSIYIFILFHSPASIVIRGIRTRVPAMTFIAFPPKTYLCYGDENGYQHAWMTVRGSMVTAMIRSCRVPLETPVRVPDQLFFDTFQRGIDTELTTRVKPHDGILKNILENFFFEIARHAETHDEHDTVERRFLAVKRHIEIHYMERLRLIDLARIAGLSASRFSTEFKRTFSVSPIDYLISMRLSEAKHLLATTASTVESIAYDVGFTDIPHFSKMFRSRFGVSPRDFRRGKKTQETV
ncbi:MAG: helix-turn-helix transcriptional regulator [Spirochaetes bacterium]|nr:helix-turn-helix transcriptional regulator [Spirochaetota bacterium]